MVEQAQSELPHECCGLLAGRVEFGIGRVLARYRLVNAARSPTRFLSDPHSMFAADRDMRERQLDILAVYHSHPTSDPVPSRTDLENNYSSDVMNLIISLKSAVPVIRAWWLTQTDSREAEFDVVKEPER